MWLMWRRLLKLNLGQIGGTQVRHQYPCAQKLLSSREDSCRKDNMPGPRKRERDSGRHIVT